MSAPATEPNKPNPWALVHRSLAAMLRRIVALERAHERAKAVKATRLIVSTRHNEVGQLVLVLDDGSEEVVGRMVR